jgi:hypothetical protein
MSNDITDLAQRYIEAWNVTDDEARRASLEAIFTEDGGYTDPTASVQGHEALVKHISAERAKFGDLRFSLGRLVSAHHDTVLFTWSLAAPGGAAVAKGYDAVVLQDGKFRQVYGYFD